jgi:hypothetical protein
MYLCNGFDNQPSIMKNSLPKIRWLDVFMNTFDKGNASGELSIITREKYQLQGINTSMYTFIKRPQRQEINR